MAEVRDSSTNLTAGADDNMSAFYAEVRAMRIWFSRMHFLMLLFNP